MRNINYLECQTWHGRKGCVKNSFSYSLDYVLFEPDGLKNPPLLFSRKRGSFFGVLDKDHGGLPRKGLGVVWVKKVLANNSIRIDGKILLLAQPRVLGHSFNPVSFWFCFDKAENLCAVIAEVNNTFGDRHSYLCVHPNFRPILPSDRLMAKKIFHVSPFQPIKGDYEFRFDFRKEKIGIWINLKLPDGGLFANLIGRRTDLTNLSIIRSLFLRPFGSRRVLGLIHWQALRLLFRGAKYRKRPLPPEFEISM